MKALRVVTIRWWTDLSKVLGEDRDLGPLTQVPHPTPDGYRPYMDRHTAMMMMATVLIGI